VLPSGADATLPEPTIELINDDVIAIQINYPPATPDPGRIFRSMAGLIEAFILIDRDLAQSVSVTAEPRLLLERIEAGSVRAVLRTLLLQIDDEGLKNLDWKPLIGQYLVRGKHALLKFLDGRPRIESRTEVLGLREDLQSLAPADAEGALLPPAPIPLDRLLSDMEALSRAVVELRDDDSAVFISRIEETRIETRLRLTQDDIEFLLTQETTRTEHELVLLVKKPDYLGNSMWEFRYNDRGIEAKMLDHGWLERFRHGEIVLQPGDALRAIVRTETAHGFEGHDVATHYFILRVLGVVRGGGGHQGDLLSSPS
jgi:hypothetical protein